MKKEIKRANDLIVTEYSLFGVVFYTHAVDINLVAAGYAKAV